MHSKSAYNYSVHLFITHMTPFKVVYGFNPLTYVDLFSLSNNE